MCRARSNLYCKDAEKRQMTEIRRDMRMSATLDCSESTVRICGAVRNLQVYKTKSKKDEVVLQDSTWISAAFREESTTIKSCLRPQNVRIAGAKQDWSSKADVESGRSPKYQERHLMDVNCKLRRRAVRIS